MTKKKPIKLAVSTAFQDAGEALRALEIAQAVRERSPSNRSIDITFLSHGSQFDSTVTDLGFALHAYEPRFKGFHLHDELQTRAGEFVGDRTLAATLIAAEKQALTELKPDAVLYGYWAFAGIVRRMLGTPIPGICFLPVPLYQGFMNIIHDLPEEMKVLHLLPAAVRRFICKHLPMRLKLNHRLVRHSNIVAAASAHGWHGCQLRNIFDMLQADLTLITDIPSFYAGHIFPEQVKVVGPIISRILSDGRIPDDIGEFLDRRDTSRPLILCTMGSSHQKEYLLEAIRALSWGAGAAWDALILSPSYICPLYEAYSVAGHRAGIHIADRFVPALAINKHARVVVSHGGLGTVQTALSCGCPILGYAMHAEQMVNLDHVQNAGAGIRLNRQRWKSETIYRTLCMMIENPLFFSRAASLQRQILQSTGRQTAADHMWQLFNCRFL